MADGLFICSWKFTKALNFRGLALEIPEEIAPILFGYTTVVRAEMTIPS